MSAKKRAEILKAINAKRIEILDLLDKNNLIAAKEASVELQKLQADYDAECEDKPANNFKPINNMNFNGGIATMNKRKALNAAVRVMLLRGYNALNDEQKQLLMPVDAIDDPGQVEGVANRGGVLVPVETANVIKEMSTGTVRLRERCDSYQTGTKSGTIPAGENPEDGLTDFDELPAGGMPTGDEKFSPINFNVHDYGRVTKVSKQLLSDANSDLMGFLTRAFAKRQVNTENARVIATLEAACGATATAVTGWKGIIGAINKSIPLGVVGSAVILTNQDGWDYLDTLTDEQGRPLLTLDLKDHARYTFRGYEVIVVESKFLPTDEDDATTSHTGTGIPFFVGSLWDAVIFVEREGLEIAMSEHAAFNQNAIAVRVVTRFDVETKFASAMKKVTYKAS